MNVPGELIPIVSILSVTAWIIGFPLARAYAKRMERVDAAPPAGVLDGIEERLARIEHSVESIAVEVERVTEGQRFLTRVFAERGGEPPALGAPAGADRAGRP